MFSRQQRVIANGNMTPFLPIDGVYLRALYKSLLCIRFSVMLNDLQAVDSERSTLVKFADDLTLLTCFS